MALFFRQLTRCFRPSPVSITTAPLAKNSDTVNVARATQRRRLCHIPAYVLVIDQSASTGYQIRMAFGRRTTRIRAIQIAGERYLKQLVASNPKQLVAVVGFSTTARLYHSLAPVAPAFHSLVRALQSLYPQSSTNLSAGLDLALGQLAKANTTRGNLVVITDGAANMETDRLPALTKQAKSSRVRIFTIGVGNNGDSEYDRDLLSHLARRTGGRFMSAHSFGALCSALNKVN